MEKLQCAFKRVFPALHTGGGNEMVVLWILCGIVDRLLGLNTEFLVGINRVISRRTKIGTMKHFTVANTRKQSRD